MSFSRIYLQAGKDQAVRRFHPWVFSGAIARTEGELADGDTVEVFDKKQTYLGTGHFHNGSIAVRIFSFQQIEPDVAFWTEKIRAIRAVRGFLLPMLTNCYRLIHGEGDGCSGLIVDYYNGVAVFQAHSIGMHRNRQVIAEALKRVYGDELIAIYDKSAETLPSAARPDAARPNAARPNAAQPNAARPNAARPDLYGAGITNGYLYGAVTVPHAVLENGHTFLIDWITGQKTGFFLDQRENRALLGRYAAGKRVLNAFCYSGGFSVYALSAGASLVHSVDVSQKAIDLTNRNVAANFGDAPTHESYVQDVMAYLKSPGTPMMRHSDGDQPYEVMVLDPPAFAKSLSARHRAVQGYKRLNAEGLRRLAKGGILFTFSCSQVVDRELFYNTIVAAAIEAGRQVRVLHHLSQAADHPVSLFHPEGSYLKGLVLWVE